MQIAYCLLLIAFACIITSAVGVYDMSGYCGIAPYPQPTTPIPQLKPGLGQYDIKLTDYHAYIRHGDRSTATLDCFSKTPYGNRNWTQCENPTTVWHTGLDGRERGASEYGVLFASMTDKQGLVGQCALGQLTQKGLMQSYNQGKRIAEFLETAYNGKHSGPGNNKKKIKITEENFVLRSTDMPRTRESMVGLIAGVFDELQHVKRNPKNMPIVGIVEEAYDPLVIGQKAMCINAATAYLTSAYGNSSYAAWYSPAVPQLNAEIRLAVNDTAQNVNTIFDCVHTYQCNGWEMPPAFQPLAQRVHDIHHWLWNHVFTHNRVLSGQTMLGGFIVDLLQKLSTSALKTQNDNNTNEPTIYLTTGHDIGPSIPLLLLLINDSDYVWPGYTSLIAFEFYKSKTPINNDTSFIRFMFNDKPLIPFVCNDYVINNELCPTRVIINYLIQMIPTKLQCPTMPQFNYIEIRNNMLTSNGFLNINNTEPQLGMIIENVYNTLVNNLHDDLNNQVNPVFRTQQQDEVDDEMKFEDLIDALNSVS